MSLELEHLSYSPESRIENSGVVLAHEIIDRWDVEQTAAYLLEHRDAPEFQEIENEHVNNAATGLFEKITAAGHLSRIRFEGDQSEIHEATVKRLLNGYNEDQPEWSRARMFQELCEELTVHAMYLKVQSGELPEDAIVVTFSDYPDDAADDREAHDNGYRVLNRKGMLRTYHFEQENDGSRTRVLEQVSRSNSHDTSTRAWFNSHAAAVPISATGALSQQAVVSKDRLPNGVVTLVEELDNTYGTERLYGESDEEMLKNNRSSYEDMRADSARNEAMLDMYIQELGDIDRGYQLLQNKGLITYQERLARFNKQTDKIIDRMLLLAPQFARDTLGDETAVAAAERASTSFYKGDYIAAAAQLKVAKSYRNIYASVMCGGDRASGEDIDDIPGADSIDGEAQDAVDDAIEDRTKWSWTKGVCQVKVCPTRPGKTMVGPCSVCKQCQAKFDEGEDPTDASTSLEQKIEDEGGFESRWQEIEEQLVKSMGSVAIAESSEAEPQLV